MSEHDTPMQVYASIFSGILELEPNLEEALAFISAMKEYAEGNFDFVSPNRTIKSYMSSFRREAGFRYAKYQEKREKLRENASKGGKATQNGKKQITDNHSSYEAIATNCKQMQAISTTTTTTTTTTDEKSLNNKLFNLSSSSSKEGREDEDEAFLRFNDFYSIWKEAKAEGQRLIEKYPSSVSTWGEQQKMFFASCCRMLADKNNKQQTIEIIEGVLSSNEGNAKTMLDKIVNAVKDGAMHKCSIDFDMWASLENLHLVLPDLTKSELATIASAMDEATDKSKWEVLNDAIKTIQKSKDTEHPINYPHLFIKSEIGKSKVD